MGKKFKYKKIKENIANITQSISKLHLLKRLLVKTYVFWRKREYFFVFGANVKCKKN